MAATKKLRVVNCFGQASRDGLLEFLAWNGVRVYLLDGAEVTGKAAFLAVAREVLPHDPHLESADNWDAFVDSLWGGLAQLQAQRVAVVWEHAGRMLEGGLPDLLEAVDCFRQLACEVATTEHGFPQPLELQLFLLGSGPNFPPFHPLRPCGDALPRMMRGISARGWKPPPEERLEAHRNHEAAAHDSRRPAVRRAG